MTPPAAPNPPQTMSRRRARVLSRRRLLAEQLEDRRLLTVFLVNDLTDGALIDLAGDGRLSLREAIEAANTDASVDGSAAGSGPDEITFTPGLTGAIDLVSKLEITDDLTIRGPFVAPGAELLSINGDETAQVLSIANVDVLLSQLVLERGRGAVYGGVIENRGNLIITGSEVLSGTAALDGGGIYNAGTLAVIDSRIAGNRADRDGGGIFNAGTMTIVNSTISRNGARSNGGGLHNDAGFMSVTGTTIAENRANRNGTTTGLGGGVWTTDDAGANTHLFNTLLVDNIADRLPSLLNDIDGKNVALGSSNNLVSDPGSAGGLVEGVSGNLLGDGLGSALPFGLLISDGTTELHGGNTSIYALAAGSRAIDAGSNTFATTPGDDGLPGTGDAGETALLSDQRGQPFDRIFAGTTDIGAYERQVMSPAFFVVTVTTDEVDYDNDDVSLREAINSANGSVGDDTITFGGPVFADALSDTIGLKHGHLFIIGGDSTTIVGPGKDKLTLDGEQRSRVIDFIGFGGDLDLSGLTITGGRTTEDGSPADGAGIRFLEGRELRITDSVITGNTIQGQFGYGGGIYSPEKVSLTRSVVSGNRSSSKGGGIFVRNFDYPTTITDSTISGNTATDYGGGVYASYSIITRSMISGNSSGSSGGGVYSDYATIVQSTITGNTSASSGGGVYSDDELTISDSTISGNTAALDGGGVHSFGSPQIIASTISGNTAGRRGGGHYGLGTQSVINSTISGNTANGGAGGIHNEDGTLTIINSTVVANRADADGTGDGLGGGVWTFDDPFTNTQLFNTIVAGNRLGTVLSDSPSDIGNKDLDLDSANNLISDPLTAGGLTEGGNSNRVGNGSGLLLSLEQIVEPSLAQNGGDTLTHALAAGSRALEGGSNTLATTGGDDGIPGTGDANETALAGDQRDAPFNRINGVAVDIGAYEQKAFDATSLIVNTVADVVDFDETVISLREALIASAARVGDDTITFDAVVFAAPSSILLELGQLSTLDANSVTIDGPGRDLLTVDAQGRSRVIDFDGYGGRTIDGLTITGGRTTQGGPDGDGAGIRVSYGGTLTLIDSDITGNTATGDGSAGGGLYSYGDVTLTRSTISGNRSTLTGGGLYTHGNATIRDSTVIGNSATLHGGGVWANDASITRSNITSNTADGNGGGVIINLGEVKIVDSMISGNTAGGEGGGVHAPFGFVSVGSTISENDASLYGGGIAAPYSGDVTLINTTVSGNSSGDRGGGLFFDDGAAEIVNSTIVDNLAAAAGGGIGNLNDNFGESLTIHNSIVAGNFDDGTGPDFVAPGDPASNLDVRASLIGDNTGTTLGESQTPDVITGNIVGAPGGVGIVDPKLDALADNGGGTFTHTPQPSSVAVDAGDVSLLQPDEFDVDGDGDLAEPLPLDQRDLGRINGGLDIGAVERFEFDYGDAPSPFATLRADDGARHVAAGPRLGDARDTENDGQPNAAADGDDLVGDDEDGAMFGVINAENDLAGLNLDVQNATEAHVDAWLDFDGNGVWSADEQILQNVAVVGGLQTINFAIPATAKAGEVYARVRVSTAGNLAPTGYSADGEVEDYRVRIISAPQVEAIQINGGEDQRSVVDRFRVTFDRLVDVDSVSGDPFRFVNADTGDAVIDTPTIGIDGGKTVVDFTFAEGPSVTHFGSLIDGNYELTIDASLITHFGIQLDGDGNGSAGGNYVFGDDAVEEFFRIYGDGDGSGMVNLTDFGMFRATFGHLSVEPEYDPIFDSNADSSINLSDFAVFRGNFGI